MIKAHNPNNLPTIDYRDLIELQPNSFKDLSQKNFDKLSNSFNVHGFITPYFVWKDKGKYFILDGHQRSRVLSTLEPNGLEVPYILIEAKNKQEAAKKLLAIDSRYGKRTAEGEQEFLDIFEIEQGYIEEVAVLEFEFEEAEEEIEAEEDDFDEAPPEIPITVLGDLYEIGEHRLLCGDSTDSDEVARLMNGEKADMVFTDPPFPNNSEIMHDMIKNIDGAFNNSRLFCDKLMIWFWDNLEFPPFLEQVTSKHIWHKTNGWQAGHFETMYCYHNDEKRHEQKVYSVNNVGGDNNREEQGNHPTPKPVSLIFEIINDLSKNSKLILDLFLGSGTTMLASHQLKRKCYAMELDCRYADVIVKRMLKLDKTLNIKKNGIDETEKWLSKINEASDEEE